MGALYLLGHGILFITFIEIIFKFQVTCYICIRIKRGGKLMSLFEHLVKNNEYPIVFIGSGISKRYLKDFPGWEELLETYWNQLGKDINFYSYLSTVSNEIKKNDPDIPENKLNYLTNIRAAQTISVEFDELFFKEKVDVPNLTPKEAYQNKVSPFKKSISEDFGNYTIKENVDEELELFKLLIRKAQIIVTTNYDTFIEDMYYDGYSGKLSTYIGNKGFFDQTEGWSELFKIHGSIEDPNSIVITEEDYNMYNKNAILISAKIIAALVNSPIIFWGYSLTDINVQNLISDFASQLPYEDSRKSAQRIVIIDWEKGLETIEEEQISDYNLGWHYTTVRTDNYSSVYSELIKINQGLSPSHVRKYHQIIKHLVLDRGKKGSLDAVLLSPEELTGIEDKINSGKPIVLALGDKAHIYRMPNIISYMNDYIFNKQEIMTEVALRFIAKESHNSRIPFARHINNVNLDRIDLTSEEKEKIRQRIDRHGSLETIIQSINRSYQIVFHQISEIAQENYKKAKEIDVVVFNINNIDTNDVRVYTEESIANLFQTASGSLKTSLRRLATAYDLKINGEIRRQDDNA
jgi:hypothetical protein